MPRIQSSDSSPPASGDLDTMLERERLPAGLGGLSVPLVAHSQRERIINAIAQSCAEKGYAETTVGDIVKLAGVSRATFYELFKDKEDCLHAAMEVALAGAMGRVAALHSPDKPWANAARDGAAALLKLMASQPDFTRMALVDAPASGERAMQLYASGKRVVHALLDRARDDPMEEEAIPSSASRAALAAVESLLIGQILAGNGERLLELLPDVVYILTVPYLGQDEALRQSRGAERLVHPAGA